MYRIETYEYELKSTKKGREIHELIMTHVDEVNQLINHNREVLVTWQRNKGAAFFSQFMGSALNSEALVAKEMEGVTLLSLIRRMAVVLQDHGSKDLADSIDRHFMLVLEYAETCDSLYRIFQKLREYE